MGLNVRIVTAYGSAEDVIGATATIVGGPASAGIGTATAARTSVSGAVSLFAMIVVRVRKGRTRIFVKSAGTFCEEC